MCLTGLAALPRPGYEAWSAATASRRRSVSSRVAGIVGLVRSTTIGEPITTFTRARRGSRVPGRRTASAPMIATGRSGAPVVSARRAAPRCHGRFGGPSTVPCGKIATAAAALERLRDGRDCADVATAPVDRDPAEPVEDPAGDPVPPQLALREEAERPLERGAEEEGIRERVVVGDDDDRPRRKVRSALDLEPPDGADRRCHHCTDRAVEVHAAGQSRIARAVSSARRA